MRDDERTPAMPTAASPLTFRKVWEGHVARKYGEMVGKHTMADVMAVSLRFYRQRQDGFGQSQYFLGYSAFAKACWAEYVEWLALQLCIAGTPRITEMRGNHALLLPEALQQLRSELGKVHAARYGFSEDALALALENVKTCQYI